MAKKGITHKQIREQKIHEVLESVKDKDELIDTLLVKLSYMGIRSQSASTGIFTKKHMCEMFKEFELDLEYICKTLNNTKGLF